MSTGEWLDLARAIFLSVVLMLWLFMHGERGPSASAFADRLERIGRAVLGAIGAARARIRMRKRGRDWPRAKVRRRG